MNTDLYVILNLSLFNKSVLMLILSTHRNNVCHGTFNSNQGGPRNNF